ncbi:HEPN domain-containing protein [bacterium]|nr:HEPN domain-containing protein [bacterium]
MIDEETKKWLIKALNDYKTAKQLVNLSEEEIITDTLCFHCQQFIEKALKAFLVLNKIEFERIHNLEYLVKLCGDIDKSFEWIYEAVRKLSQYAIEIRYPDEFYIPTIDEARECFEITSNVKVFILEKFGIKDEEIK